MLIQESKMRVVNKIPCECGKVYFGETKRSMLERIKEHYQDKGLLEHNHPLFQSTVVRPDTIRSGTKLSLLIETGIGTHVGLRRLFT